MIVYLMGVHFMGRCLMGVYLMVMYLMGVHLMGGCLMGESYGCVPHERASHG
jgi:hypothetical protein